MRKFGLIGYPLSHSFSKQYFKDKFHKMRITDCSYELFPLPDIKQLPELINSMPELFGLNVTIPHKSEVIPYLDTISTEASEIGAVNVIKIKREGYKIVLQGYNSDVNGIRDSVQHYLAGTHGNAIVLGTGGSSKAVTHVLQELGMTVISVSRKEKPGSIEYSKLSPELLKSSRIIVNTTPLGMFPEIESKPEIDYNLLDNNNILFDLVYNPELTSFLKAGQERGCTIITGLKMLYSQAERSWEIWNDDKL